MGTKIIAGKEVQVNDEGFMTDPSEWNKDIAAAIAAEEGVAELTDAHWKIIDYCRDSAPKLNGNAPTLRQITTGTGVSTKELFALFPKGPAKKVAKISGLGKPEGCV
ncbi:MAG: TusE/DsrC/DsvC family sulfur relay protein [Actinobacteria bacterium]|nr:TusE/DsrC/DsvC family sulfur relay protein [Actinomycetota bacterium]